LRNQLASATRSGREVIANGTLATVLKCAVYVAQCGDAKMAKQRKFAQGDATVFSVPHGLQNMLGVEVTSPGPEGPVFRSWSRRFRDMLATIFFLLPIHCGIRLAGHPRKSSGSDLAAQV
jgi:hypothetical protein